MYACSVKKSPEDALEQWLDILQSRVPGAVVLLVGTHSDLFGSNLAESRARKDGFKRGRPWGRTVTVVMYPCPFPPPVPFDQHSQLFCRGVPIRDHVERSCLPGAPTCLSEVYPCNPFSFTTRRVEQSPPLELCTHERALSTARLEVRNNSRAPGFQATYALSETSFIFC